MKRLIVTTLLACSIVLVLKAQTRITYTINDRWHFEKGESVETDNPQIKQPAWLLINLPHTYNNLDGDDEQPGYYRGTVRYRKSVFIDKIHENKHAVIYFEGANQEVEVFVNGQSAGKHIGGYTRFSFDISRLIRFGEKNNFEIKVDNKHNPDIPPLSADFTFYGGIYRDVYLQFTNKIHVATNNLASSGVYVKTPQVSEKEAFIEIHSLISNDTESTVNVIIENTIVDSDGKKVKTVQNKQSIFPKNTITDIQKKIRIENPILWDIDNPHLYSVFTRVYNSKSGEMLDEVSNSFGLRWFEFDRDKGFFLNGKHRKLRGTNRHQDYFEKGNALRDEMHVRDLLLLKEMGINFLRISHYPQDPVVLEMCDKLGIVTSVEIPIVNAITESDAFLKNAVHMLKEMIWQNFNHPSIVIWGYMNEVLLRQPYSKPEELVPYYLAVENVARELENTVRFEDPSRYTMMAYHNAPERYEQAKLTEIPMIMGWNLYQGWYEPDINEFQRLLDRAYNTYKDKILLVTEYGPGVDPRLHSFNPERFDFTQEYGIVYHRHYYEEMMKRPFIAGFNMWNFNDFYAEQRIDAVPHVNNKGVTGLDRERKDGFLFYKTQFNTNPLVLIGNREWKTRGGVAEANENVCRQPVPVFSNLPEVELIVNGKSLGVKKCEGNVAEFIVPFVHGENVIEASGTRNDKIVRDLIHVNFKLTPNNLKSSQIPFLELNVMLGSHRYFEDRKAEMIWLPEKPYEKGGWGYIGGEVYRRKTNFGSMLGADIDIYGTDNNPIFQTQRKGIESFKADIPDGRYSIYLYWAELDSDEHKELSEYNIGMQDTRFEKFYRRTFDVCINGVDVLKDFNITEEYGYGTAVIKKFIVDVKSGEGLSVDFRKKEGETVLNAVRIYRNY